MKLRSLGERELIALIAKEFPKKGRDIILGIGDDAALIKPGKIPIILTKDLLVEKVDFFRSLHPPYFLGRKSLNVSLSDIAAMGGRPRFALLGLGLPPATRASWIGEFLHGFKSAALEAGVRLIGGDLSRAREILISVTVLGDCEKAVPRSGGKPGHLLFVSGFLGDARAGLRLLGKGFKPGRRGKAGPLLKAFLDPTPQLKLGRELARRKLASAMIDLSDGLSVDLMHLCDAGGTGAEIVLDRLPLSPEIRAFIRRPIALALHGGEDFELLFAAPPKNRAAIRSAKLKPPVYEIGRLTARKGIFIIDGQGVKKPLEPRGYEHFK